MADFQKLNIDLQNKIYKEIIYCEKNIEINMFKKEFYKYCLEKNIHNITSESVLDEYEKENIIKKSNKFIEDYISNIDEKTKKKIMSETDDLVSKILNVNEDEYIIRFTFDGCYGYNVFNEIKCNSYDDYYKCILVKKILLHVLKLK